MCFSGNLKAALIVLLLMAGNDTLHHVELTNRICWLLNDDVPDSLFEDPLKSEVVLPVFPDYPKE
jgi:hypothetical protein